VIARISRLHIYTVKHRLSGHVWISEMFVLINYYLFVSSGEKVHYGVDLHTYMAYSSGDHLTVVKVLIETLLIHVLV